MPQKCRLLFVDDESFLLRAYRRTFAGDYDVLTATSGLDALALLATETVDVAIVDHLMPRMSGVELIRQIKETHPEIPCLIVTGYADFEEVRQASRSGLALAVISKPWKKEELEQWIVQINRLSGMHRAVGDLKAWHKRTTSP